MEAEEVQSNHQMSLFELFETPVQEVDTTQEEIKDQTEDAIELDENAEVVNISFAFTDEIQKQMEEAGVSADQFSVDQMEVLQYAYNSGINLTPMLNPEFSPEQMQLISDVLERNEITTQARMEQELEPLVDHPMDIEEVNQIRREQRMPLESVEPDDSDTEKSETQIPDHQTADKSVVERHNFHITDQDLGAGGPKQKFQANIAAIELLQILEAENRLATPEEQEILSRYVGWGGIPQAFDEQLLDGQRSISS